MCKVSRSFRLPSPFCSAELKCLNEVACNWTARSIRIIFSTISHTVEIVDNNFHFTSGTYYPCRCVLSTRIPRRIASARVLVELSNEFWNNYYSMWKEALYLINVIYRVTFPLIKKPNRRVCRINERCRTLQHCCLVPVRNRWKTLTLSIGHSPFVGK